MRDLWDRFEAWAGTNASGQTLGLRPPATEQAIADAEAATGMSFPEDFRASLLVHDGQEDHDGNGHFDWMPGCDRLAPLASIVAQWKDEQDRIQDAEEEDCEVVEGGRFKNLLWHSKRIPIAGSPYWDQDNTYLDLVPGPKGTSGQLVTMTSECDFSVLGRSFRDAFARYVDALESGEWGKQKVSGHTAEAFAAMSEPKKPKAAPKSKAKPAAKKAAPKKKPAAKKKAAPKKKAR